LTYVKKVCIIDIVVLMNEVNIKK